MEGEDQGRRRGPTGKLTETRRKIVERGTPSH
jgi:hypothetical protein